MQMLKGFGNMCTVDIGNKVKFNVFMLVMLQSFGYHKRAKVGTTNANVYNIRYWFSRIAFP